MSLRLLALVGAAALVVGFLENTFFGADSGGAKHYVSVGFFFLALLGLAMLAVAGIAAVVRRIRSA